MLTPPWHLILPSLLSKVRVALHSILYVFFELWLRLILCYFAILYMTALSIVYYVNKARAMFLLHIHVFTYRQTLQGLFLKTWFIFTWVLLVLRITQLVYRLFYCRHNLPCRKWTHAKFFFFFFFFLIYIYSYYLPFTTVCHIPGIEYDNNKLYNWQWHYRHQ